MVSVTTTNIMAAVHREEISIRGKPTEVLSLGATLNDKPKNILLIIPGNPGVTSYYRDFMQSLYSGVKDTHAVWAVSHAGHCHTSSLPFWPDGQHIYNLEDQIQHKIAFILDHVPKDTKITLIGHSVGAYIILNILKAFETNPDVNIDKNYLLFPTIERMKITPNGRILWPMFWYLRWLLILLTVFAYVVPVKLKEVLFKLYFWGRVVPECCVEATTELLHPKIIQNVLWMAHNELLHIIDADIEALEKHKDRLVLYYGATDGWCPQSYRKELIMKVDGLRTYLCEEGFPHAFVLGYSEGMAHKIVKWVQT